MTGNAEFLAERTKARALQQVRAERAECQVAQVSATGMAPGEFTGLTGASLFSEASAVVLTELENLPEACVDELVQHATNPAPDVVVICIHSGGNKGKGLLDKLRKLGAVTEVKLTAPKYERDFTSWVRDEARNLSRSIDEEAASALVQAVGQDLRALAGAIDQLAATIEPGRTISAADVGQYFGGRAEVRGYEIADAAVDGRVALALEKLRWAETAKVAPVLVTAAFASSLRGLAQVAAAPNGLPDGEVAKIAGVPPFKIRALRQQLSAWSPARLSRAISAVAQADLDVKGGLADANYALERMVISVAAARSR
jgi:DNA polymerase III subunit delta